MRPLGRRRGPPRRLRDVTRAGGHAQPRWRAVVLARLRLFGARHNQHPIRANRISGVRHASLGVPDKHPPFPCHDAALVTIVRL